MDVTGDVRVLVVDDDTASRLLSSAVIEAEGATVHEAVDGRQGLQQAFALLPHLIVTDVMMPVLDGFGFVDALRQDDRTAAIPLVFLSGETDPEIAVRARRAGALGYLTKPLDATLIGPLLAGAAAGA